MSKSVEARVNAQLGKTRNSKVLASFIAYCQQHTEERFWQALRNWCGMNFVFVSNSHPMQNPDGSMRGCYDGPDLYNTFYWEGIGTNVPEPDEKLDRPIGNHIREAVAVIKDWRKNANVSH
jgi:hypothetical protein